MKWIPSVQLKRVSKSSGFTLYVGRTSVKVHRPEKDSRLLDEGSAQIIHPHPNPPSRERESVPPPPLASLPRLLGDQVHEAYDSSVPAKCAQGLLGRLHGAAVKGHVDQVEARRRGTVLDYGFHLTQGGPDRQLRRILLEGNQRADKGARELPSGGRLAGERRHSVHPPDGPLPSRPTMTAGGAGVTSRAGTPRARGTLAAISCRQRIPIGNVSRPAKGSSRPASPSAARLAGGSTAGTSTSPRRRSPPSWHPCTGIYRRCSRCRRVGSCRNI